MTWLSWPNRITIARILLIIPLVLCLLNMGTWSDRGRWVAFALFCVIAAGDALDGYLARRLDEETPLGRFLDPLADKLLMTSTVILLSLPSSAVAGFQLPNWVPVLLIGKDVLIVLGFGLVYATTDSFYVSPRMLGKACTLIQSLMIAAVLLGPDWPAVMTRVVPILWVGATGLAVAATLDYFVQGNRFARLHHTRRKSTENGVEPNHEHP